MRRILPLVVLKVLEFQGHYYHFECSLAFHMLAFFGELVS